MKTVAANLKSISVNRLVEAAGDLRRTYSLGRWAGHFVLLAGSVLAVLGTGFVAEFFARTQSLAIADPVLGIPFRFVFLGFGILQLVVSGFCLLTSRRSLSIGLVLWLVANLLIYRLEMRQAGWMHPYAFVSPLTERLFISVGTADILLAGAAAYLLVGGSGTLLALRWARRVEEFRKISCPACGVHIRFAVENTGQSISCPKCRAAVTLRKPEEDLKMSCYFCKGHIEFPPHAIGEKIKCPHCRMDITLTIPA